jgi:hypothetical protein
VCIGSPGTKGEHALLEVNMARHNNTVSLRIKTLVTLGVRWVTQKDAHHRTRRELVGGRGSQVWITQAPKNSKVIIGRIMAQEELVECGIVAGGKDGS